MKCKKVERLLSSYLDNSLRIALGDEIKGHLAKCEKCMDHLNTMTKIDNLLKLKVKEKPSKEYWENYWPRLERRLDRTTAPQLSEGRRWFNLFIPKFSPTFSGILIALLILVQGIVSVYIQQLTSLQFILWERQEGIQEQFYRYLSTKPDESVIDTRVILDRDVILEKNVIDKSGVLDRDVINI